MVNAILSGSKTQTRRVVKAGKDRAFGCDLSPCEIAGDINQCERYDLCPYGQPGDRLWVRETHAIIEGDTSNAVIYRACQDFFYGGRWRPSVYMPRWASRITLEVTSVRVERLKDISEQDAIAEGIERVGGEYSCNPWRNYRIGKPGEMNLHCSCARRSYMTLWESINGAGSWAANPWVWVVEFQQDNQGGG